MKKGDALFNIDPELYQATVERLEPQLKLAELRLKQTNQLVKAGAGRPVVVEEVKAQIKQLKAQLKAARSTERIREGTSQNHRHSAAEGCSLQ